MSGSKNKIEDIVTRVCEQTNQLNFKDFRATLTNEVMDHLAQRFGVAIARAHGDPVEESVLLRLWGELRGDWIQHPGSGSGQEDEDPIV